SQTDPLTERTSPPMRQTASYKDRGLISDGLRDGCAQPEKTPIHPALTARTATRRKGRFTGPASHATGPNGKARKDYSSADSEAGARSVDFTGCWVSAVPTASFRPSYLAVKRWRVSVSSACCAAWRYCSIALARRLILEYASPKWSRIVDSSF